jgi:hypothetical protein
LAEFLDGGASGANSHGGQAFEELWEVWCHKAVYIPPY